MPTLQAAFVGLMCGPGASDPSLRQALMSALEASAPQVLQRLTDSSKILDALHAWLQVGREGRARGGGDSCMQRVHA